MRPPAIQAERRCWWTRRESNPQCFNEAACNTGGTPTNAPDTALAPACFNEAACNTGGTRIHSAASCIQRRASMRPPAIQAERRYEEAAYKVLRELQ